MQIRVLGAAAGGAFPQWNCSCSNCKRLRQNRFPGQQRSQTQLAISVDGDHWFLLNASPDLRYQIESFPPLHPRPEPSRNSPVAGIVLLSAEVDAALGLLLLRESQPLKVYATEAVRRLLTEDNSLFAVLRRQPGQVVWTDIVPGSPFDLVAGSLRCTPISAGGGFPGFVPDARARMFSPDQAVLGLLLEHDGCRVAFFPGVSKVDPEWLPLFENCDAVLCDGTFWSDDELVHAQGSGKTAHEIGHQPVQETLSALARVKSQKLFIHINNTNPILDESSPEYQSVRAAGWEVACDGMEITI